MEEAKEQAEWEFGAALGEWREVPPDLEDPEEFAIEQASLLTS